MSRIAQSRGELLAHLEEQRRFLEASAAAFDRGFEGEAKRLAVVLRILLHDSGRNSRSLLGSLGVKDEMLFDDFAGECGPQDLIFIGLQTGFTETGLRYYAHPGPAERRIRFIEWWPATVIIQATEKVRVTREFAVLSLADMDGGAHVDPTLDAEYFRISRENAMGWEPFRVGSQDFVVSSPIPAVVRQVAGEVMSSLDAQPIC